MLLGFHGKGDGTMQLGGELAVEDFRKWGDTPNVNVLDMRKMRTSEVTDVLNSSDTTIGGFCNSRACLGGDVD